jgi:1-acyl-sn-glycerol-3-phosphate acyltransferase
MSAKRQAPTPTARVVGGLRLVVFYAFCAFYIPIIILMARAKPGDDAWYRLARLWARATLAWFRIRVEAHGLAHLREGEDYILMANHRSHFDPLAIIVALGTRETRWVAKRELLRVPIFGYGLRVTGQILIDRRDHSQALEAMRANLGKRGASVVFFAEGERSATGELGKFKKGGAAFAIDAGLSVVPVAVTGSERVLPKHSLVVVPGRVRVAFGEPISTRGLGAADRDGLTSLVHNRVAKLIQDLEPAEARAA